MFKRVSSVRTGGVLLFIFSFWISWLPELVLAGPSAAVSIGLRPRDPFPPTKVTDLEAASSLSNEGEVVLIWSAPHEGNISLPAAQPVKKYFVRYSTVSVPALGSDTTAWWDLSTNAAGEPSSPQIQGSQESFSLTGLEPGATIYFGIKSTDHQDQISLIDEYAETGPQANALILDLAPPAVTGLATAASSTTITLSWNASTAADITDYIVYWDSASPADVFVPTVTVPVGIHSATFTNLTSENTYYFYVTAKDKGSPNFLGNVLESTTSAIVSAFTSVTIPLAPSNFGAAVISTTSIVWQWQDNSNNENEFRVYSSTGGMVGTVNAAGGIGSTVQFAETTLAVNASYSRSVKAYNTAGESLGSNTTDRFTLSNPPVGTAVSNVSTTTVTISWLNNGNPASTNFEAWISTDSGFSIYSFVNGVSTSAIFTGLLTDSTYFAQVRSKNGGNAHSAFDASVSTKTLQAGIQGLVAVAGDRKVTLDWAGNSEPDHQGYFIYRTTNLAEPLNLLNGTPIPESFYEDKGLTNGVTYYYQITPVNSSGIHGKPSNIVFARPVKPSTARPQEPTGISGSLSPDGKFTLSWTPVSLDILGSTRVELAGYRIYKSTDMEGPFEFRDLVSPATYSWLSPDLVPPAVWYLLRAFDISDNESDNSTRIQTLAAPMMVVAAPDESMHMLVPLQDLKTLSAANNLNEETRIVITRKPEEEINNILTSYDIRSFGAVTGNEIKDLKFSKPAVEMQFRYTEGNQGARQKGAPKPANAPKFRAFAGSPKDVGIFWHNTVEFVKFGGTVNEARGSVSLRTGRPTGKFQVKQVLRATEFTLSQLTPRKTFTPNGDGVNDEISLFMENPKESVITQAKIYDITGAEVADFEQGFVAGSLGLISLNWDGRDRDGSVVRSGIYIYQVQAEGKVINGTIVVAR